jgi:glycosyltransferase involved in cell wall biosynthesis
MNILVLTPYIPYPPNFGGSVRIFHLIRQLHRFGHAVHLLSFHYPQEHGEGSTQGLEPFCKTLKLIGRDIGRKRFRQFVSLFSRRSFQWSFHYSDAMQVALEQLTREQKIDLILVEFSQMAGYRFPAGVPVVLDEHNVEFDLLDRMAARENGAVRKFFNRVEARKFRREELAACRAAALTLVTSERDGAVLRQHAPGLRTATITNGVDCDQFARPAGVRHPDTAVFVGATHYFPNEEGVLYFLREAYPLIKEKHPQFRFTVVGGKPPTSIVQLQTDAVQVTGYVNDVRPFMWESSVFVVPLRMGGGTRFKIVEAFAAGIPVVSTRLGAEGIPVEDGRELLLADTPAELAAAVLRVLEDPGLAASLARAGLDYVRRHFDWSVIGVRLDAALAGSVKPS